MAGPRVRRCTESGASCLCTEATDVDDREPTAEVADPRPGRVRRGR
jgi:hypothetical protein